MNAEVSKVRDGYVIQRGDIATLQRREVKTAAETPLSSKEELICDLCETVLATEREAMEGCKGAIEELCDENGTVDERATRMDDIEAIEALIEQGEE